jgi:YVTN family beta-propeller protein
MARYVAVVLLVGLLLLSALGAFALGSPASASPSSAVAEVVPGPSGAVPAAASSAAATLAPTASPSAAPAEIPVGEGPDAIVLDTANNTAFVANQFTNNITEIQLSTQAVLQSVTVGSQPAPAGLALDVPNGTLYVANSGSNNVSAVSLSYGGISASIPVGSYPDAAVYDPTDKDVYVADAGSAEVTVISTINNMVVATIPVQSNPDAILLDPVSHNLFVADAGTDNVSVVSTVSNLVLATVMVGSSPGVGGAIAFNPLNNSVLVANQGSNNVSVIGGTNHTAYGSIPVGSGPSGIAVDVAAREAFVANRFSSNVTVIALKNGTPVASVPVGSQPGIDDAIALASAPGDIVVANSGSGNVSVLSAQTNALLGSVPVLSSPDAVAVDPATGLVWVADQGASNLSVFGLTTVTFSALGLPAGSTWSVTSGTPAVVHSNTTVLARGLIRTLALSGVFDYTITAPSGFGVRSLVGAHFPSQISANVSGTAVVLTVTFGHLETLTFTETGLPSGDTWGIALRSTLLHGGPAAQAQSGTGTSLAFTVVEGGWRYAVTPKPSIYEGVPQVGVVVIPAHAVTHAVVFHLVTRAVLFREIGLRAGTRWEVTVSGPMNVTVTSASSVVRFVLENGTYNFTVENFSTLHPHPANGTFTVIAPGVAVVESIQYDALTGGLPAALPTPGTGLEPAAARVNSG